MIVLIVFWGMLMCMSDQRRNPSCMRRVLHIDGWQTQQKTISVSYCYAYQQHVEPAVHLQQYPTAINNIDEAPHTCSNQPPAPTRAFNPLPARNALCSPSADATRTILITPKALTGGIEGSKTQCRRPSLAATRRFSMATTGHGNFIPSTVSQQFSSCHCNTGRESLHATATSGGMRHLWLVGERSNAYQVCFLGASIGAFGGGASSRETPDAAKEKRTAAQEKSVNEKIRG